MTYILINTFTAVPGGLDELVAFQLAETARMSSEATATGWLGNELYRSEDERQLIVLTRFASRAAQESWAETESFQRHVAALRPKFEDMTSVPVSFVTAHGEPPERSGTPG